MRIGLTFFVTFLVRRPCDDLAEIRTRLLAQAEKLGQNGAAAAGAVSEPPHAAAAAPEHASQGPRACQIRLRLGDGSQVSLLILYVLLALYSNGNGRHANACAAASVVHVM